MKVEIIIGSTRPSRVGDQIGQWVKDHLPQDAHIDYEIVDLAQVNLPLFDEPIKPMLNQYQHDYTKAWSQKVKEADGYIFVTPEYNAGYPASLKNAIDYLYHEWTAKAVAIVSYGVGGGGSASAQLRQVAERLKMRPTNTSPALVLDADMADDTGRLKDPDTAFAQYEPELKVAATELAKLLAEPQADVT